MKLKQHIIDHINNFTLKIPKGIVKIPSFPKGCLTARHTPRDEQRPCPSCGASDVHQSNESFKCDACGCAGGMDYATPNNTMREFPGRSRTHKSEGTDK